MARNIYTQGEIYNEEIYFSDRKRKIDFVLVTDILKMSNEFEILLSYLVNLMEQGVQYEFNRGLAHPDLIFIKLHCPLDLLVHVATINDFTFDYQLQRLKTTKATTKTWFFCKIFNNVATAPNPDQIDFKRARSSLANMKRITPTSWERTYIMEKILADTKFGTSEGQKGLQELKRLKIITDAYALHDGSWEYQEKGPLTDRQLLSKYWANFKCMAQNQPLDLIYKYYGPEVAFYFTFVDYYTKMLTIPALFGILCFVYNLPTFYNYDASRITEVCTSTNTLCPNCYEVNECKFTPVEHFCYAVKYNAAFENYAGVCFAIFTSIWATFFLGMWLRRENFYKFQWNVLHCETDTTQRSEFREKAKRTRISPASGRLEFYMPTNIQIGRYIFSFLCCLFCLAVILVLIVLVTYLRIVTRKIIAWLDNETLKQDFSLLGILVRAIATVIIIHILTPLFWKLAIYLTNEENPRTFIDYYNSCTYKYYLLLFANNYLPLFYVAFVKGIFYTHPGDISNYYRLALSADVCLVVGCLLSLTIYIISLIGFNTIVLKICQVISFHQRKKKKTKGGPYLYYNIDPNQHVPAWETDYELSEAGNLFLITHFAEVVILHGLVLFFVAGLSLTPVMALISNVIQIRLDAKRILRFYRRPVTKLLPGIGSWNSILRLVTFIGAMTNALVIAFTTDLIDMEVYQMSHDTLEGYVNTTLSEFALVDFPNLFDDLLDQEKKGMLAVCSYKGRRKPYYEKDKYLFSEEHWRVLSYKLFFMLVFQQMIWLITGMCSAVMHPIPDEVLAELNEEAIRTRDEQITNFMQNLKRVDKGSTTSHFQIT